jgi:L-amino acid N-acyltransferase YncA
MQPYTIRRPEPSDIPLLRDILNHYALHTAADFSDRPHTLAEVRSLVQGEERLPTYVAVAAEQVVGFAAAYPFRPEHTFIDTVKFTYWLQPSFTGKGIGTLLYNQLESECWQNGVRQVLVNISSENTGSIRLHERRGFVRCGHFKEVARKNGRCFDIIWMQKRLREE